MDNLNGQNQNVNTLYRVAFNQSSHLNYQNWENYPQNGQYSQSAPFISEQNQYIPQEEENRRHSTSTNSNGSSPQQHMGHSCEQPSLEGYYPQDQYWGQNQQAFNNYGLLNSTSTNHPYPQYSANQCHTSDANFLQGYSYPNQYDTATTSEAGEAFGYSNYATNPEPNTYGQSFSSNYVGIPQQTASQPQQPEVQGKIDEEQEKNRHPPKELKSYYAIQNKRPNPKMKTVRKKRSSANALIPYVNKDDKNIFTCKFGNCGLTFDRCSNVRRHMTAMHEPLYIICCHRLFPTKTHFEDHRLTVHAEGYFHCTISDCERKFNRKALLHRHEARFHSPVDIPTPICSVCHMSLPEPEENKSVILAHAISHSCLA